MLVAVMKTVWHDEWSRSYLVGLVGGSSGNLALVSRGELGEVTVVVTLPVRGNRVNLNGSRRKWGIL
jgi:hypothetical protein